jgi:hypothetical protein
MVSHRCSIIDLLMFFPAYHCKCVDPWLTKNRKVCPVCKRKVGTSGDDSSDSDAERNAADTAAGRRERSPLLNSTAANPGRQVRNFWISSFIVFVKQNPFFRLAIRHFFQTINRPKMSLLDRWYYHRRVVHVVDCQHHHRYIFHEHINLVCNRLFICDHWYFVIIFQLVHSNQLPKQRCIQATAIWWQVQKCQVQPNI